ncbi:MAG TPA: hypothetical protein VKK79_11865, partial [Candidatus Lokiarchaeia archaeon]|nr:hypothetical protein [Candidatus Lokiarchaeia archaeon]
SLRGVVGTGMHFLLEWGEDVVTLVVTDQDTYYLRQAMKQFTRDFEACYPADIKAQNPDVSCYGNAKDIIKRNFPFFVIE